MIGAGQKVFWKVISVILTTFLVLGSSPQTFATNTPVLLNLNNVPDYSIYAKLIAAGSNHSLAIISDGTVVAWGNNDQDEITVPAGLNGVVAVSAGTAYSLALKNNGTVVAWGRNDFGQTNVPGSLNEAVAVSAGGYHSLALKSDTTVTAWGWNAYGQTNMPVGLTGVIAVAAGGYHSLALKSDGTVVAWGYNGYGQTSVPAGLNEVVAVAAGPYYSLALKADGTVVGWGASGSGTYGWGLPIGIPTDLQGGVAIAAGIVHGLALKSDQTVVAWGAANTYGQRSVPEGLDGVVAVAAGAEFSLALKSDGTLIAWGFNVYGETNVPEDLNLFTSTVVDAEKPVITLNGPSEVTVQVRGTYKDLGAIASDNLDGDITTNIIVNNPVNTLIAGTYIVRYNVADSSGNAAVEVIRTVHVEDTLGTSVYPSDQLFSAGNSQNVAIRSNGTLVAWGNNSDGQLNIPAGLNDVAAVSTGSAFSMALKKDGTVVAWGSGTWGQTNIPVDLPPVIAVAAGHWGFSVVLTREGKVVAWGRNDLHQIEVPSDLNGVDAIAAGKNHTLALKDDGTVVAWGDNSNGQATVPEGLNNVKAIAAGAYHSLALRSDGTVIAWGVNYAGQCTIPDGLSGVVAISGGDAHSLALKEDGTVVIWGSFRPDINMSVYVPTDLSDVVAISAGSYHDLAMKRDGTVVAWGDNSYGQTNLPPSLNLLAPFGPDTVKPVITLNGPSDLTVYYATPYYNDAGAVATDDMDGDISRKLVVTSMVDTHVLGTHTVRYNVTDYSDNAADEVTRTVHVVGFKDDFATDSGLWDFVGTANRDVSGGYAVLTQTVNNNDDAIWLKKDLNQPITTSFRMKISNNTGNTGIVFNAFGETVEIDNWENQAGNTGGNWDPMDPSGWSNHSHYVWADALNDGAWHDVKVQMDNSQVTVFLDGQQVLSDMLNSGTGNPQIGFTAVEGTAGDQVYIDDFRLDDGVEPPPVDLQTYYASPVVQLGMNASGYAGIYLGIKDIKDQAGLVVTSEKLTRYQIDLTYQSNLMKVLDCQDQTALSDTFLFDIDPGTNLDTGTISTGQVHIAAVAAQGIANSEHLVFIPLALTGGATDLTTLTIEFSAVRDQSDNSILVADPASMVFQRGNIINTQSSPGLDIADAIVGLQYLANTNLAGFENNQVNLVNMASSLSLEINEPGLTPNVKDVISLLQYLVGLRNDYFESEST